MLALAQFGGGFVGIRFRAKANQMNGQHSIPIFRRPADSGLGRLAGAVFRSFRHSGLRFHGRLVCRPAQAVVESTGLDLWPGVDVALRDDGSRGVAGMARGWLESARAGAWIVSPAMVAQRAVDAAVLWDAPFRAGFRGNHHALVGAGSNPAVCSGACGRRLARC